MEGARTQVCAAAGGAGPHICALARANSSSAAPPGLLQLEAIYHTSIVVAGVEHFFGGGINVAAAGTTPFGRPIQVLDLG